MTHLFSLNPLPPWRLTGFYGWPEDHMKHESWILLKHLKSRYLASWLCIGDYNEILALAERQGRLPKPQNPMQLFRTTLLQCGLVDLGFVGSIFTWNNGREGDAFVQERLDRACATVDWREMFSHGKVTHLTASYSDHIPILLTTQEPNQPLTS